jgi:hypothetical protein
MSVLIVLQKPAQGQPCNRCGVCCTRELCSIAMSIFRPGAGDWYPHSPDWSGPCPALESAADGQTNCGVFTQPERYIIANPETIAERLTIGRGCLASD